jgi:hypothetical protein
MYVILIYEVFMIRRFISSFAYGSPNSILVNLIGKNLDNFVEYKKTGNVSIFDKNLTIIYQKDIMVEMGPPEKQKKGKYQISYLVLGQLTENQKEYIIHENIIANKVIVDKENKRLFYTFKDRSVGSYKNYLIVFDLATMQIINNILILDDIKYKSEFLSVSDISEVLFDNIHNKILFQINHYHNIIYLKGKDYISFDIETRKMEDISEKIYNETLNNPNITKSPFSYMSDEGIKKLFFIYPYSDYLPANYKHKYTGTYVNDGLNNIRISKLTSYSANDVFWLENGQYVIYGSYIYATSGKINETKIIDGKVLAVY